MERLLVLVKGGGEMASGIAHRLFLCNFDVVITEIQYPTVIRRYVSFAQAVFSKEVEVEGVKAVLCNNKEEIKNLLQKRVIPVIIDPEAKIKDFLKPEIIIDAIMAKKNLGTNINDANLVIGIGPGFKAGHDVHFCIETMRGHRLGRVIEKGEALPNTGIPGNIGGYTKERVVRAPEEGIFENKNNIGDIVKKGEIIGYILKEKERLEKVEVKAPISGVIRGLINNGSKCYKDMKIGDIDPRGVKEYCWEISDKARTISGGVLEAILRKYKVVKP